MSKRSDLAGRKPFLWTRQNPGGLVKHLIKILCPILEWGRRIRLERENGSSPCLASSSAYAPAEGTAHCENVVDAWIFRWIHDAKLPRVKTLEEFDFSQASQIPATKIRELAEGGYIERAEPVVFLGECGTGKTHLTTGLCVAACRQKKRVRFTTAANLVNELVEAKQHNGVKRVLTRWLRYDVIALDEVGYVPLAEIGAEFLFQVIAERAERAAVIVTTNLPFSEWTQVFPNPRLCKALLDHRPGAHYRHPGLNRTVFGERSKGGKRRKLRRVGQMRVSKVGQVRLSNAIGHRVQAAHGVERPAEIRA